MSIQSRYVHTLVVKREVQTRTPVHDPPEPGDDEPIVDEYNQPVYAASTVATVPGLVQPRSGSEAGGGGEDAAVRDLFVGFMDPLAGLTTRDWIERDGVRYDILDVRDAAGLGHHLELDLKAVR